MKKILCESNPMCYGSSAALLSVIEYINMDIYCLINGITKEILSNNPKITQYIEVDNKSPEQVQKAIQNLEFEVVLVVSNTSNLALYKRMNKVVIFLHIHFFYTNIKRAFLSYVDHLFVQQFWDLSPINHPYTQVAPIIQFPTKIKNTIEKICLVNLGGGESRFIKPGENSGYGELVVTILGRLVHVFRGYRIVIAGGKKIIESVKDYAMQFGFEAQTFCNSEYLKFLSKSSILITAPGLNAVFEGLYAKIPIVFLPPQNYSQLIQLNKYEKAGLAISGLNFDLDKFNSDSLTEESLTKLFLLELQQLASTDELIQNVIQTIENQLQYIQTEKFRYACEAARNFLGNPKNKTISQFINKYYA